MKRVAALLAAVALGLAWMGCGGDGAEPGAPRGATLVLDFQPNAVHAGIYAALASGYYGDEGLALTVREPSASADAPKLLAAGRTDFAILDIHDLGLARERGLDVVGIEPLTGRPLAAVIAGNRSAVRDPCDLAGGRVGVTGLPSDDAVLDSVLDAVGCAPSVLDRVTIGFNAVSSVAAGEVDAATGFWNAEGVGLRRLDIPTREFRVDDYGAPRYPELVLCTSGALFHKEAALVTAMTDATSEGYAFAVDHPRAALADLLDGTSGLDGEEQAAQMDALLAAHAFVPSGRFSQAALRGWARWDVAHGILERPLSLSATFPTVAF